METFYLVCAGVGGTVMVLQFFASAIGIGLETETETDHDADHGNHFFGMLTLRSVAAAVAFFGLVGMVSLSGGLAPAGTFAAATTGGLLALYLVATVMNLFKNLQHDGTIRAEDAIGVVGTVYLRVPGQSAGPGKITLTLQNRTVEYDAYTSGETIPTGGIARVISLRGAGAVEVEAIVNPLEQP